MIQFPAELKTKVVAALLEVRKKFDGSDTQFAKQWGINNSVFSRIKNGDNLEGLLRDAQWLNIARELDVTATNNKWNVARTDVYCMIEEDVIFCKTYAKGFILCDDTGIGKTFTAKHLARTLNNCFYIDARQANTKFQLVRLLARAIGVDDNDKFVKIKANIKYALKLLPNPIVIIDEAGALDYDATMLLVEFWNGTEKACGWYLMGADGLREKLERGINNKKVGFAELFSRFNEKYNTVVPAEKNEKVQFYKKLITDVLQANAKDKGIIPGIVKRCLVNDSGRISGLRRAETLLLLAQQAA